MANLIISNILDYSSKIGSSDIHITEGKPLTFRINGNLDIKRESGIIDSVKIKQILLELLKEDKELVKEFFHKKDMDFAYLHSDGTSFRVNAYYKLGKISFVLRRIATEVKTMKELGLPPSSKFFTKVKQGLILVTGPTGSGKSTTMISILDEINKTRKEHILTIEDPVEYIFKDNNSVFSQREIGRDTKGFPSALRAAMREDPDIIMIGEMRDEETVKAALELAETGHLVISTLHTAGSVQTITRLVNFFSTDNQNAIRYKLSDTLVGVLSQRLIPKADGSSRVGIFEIMFMTVGIKNLIRTGDLNQINSNIETGSKYGMITMKDYADKLNSAGIVKEEDYINYFKETE